MTHCLKKENQASAAGTVHDFVTGAAPSDQLRNQRLSPIQPFKNRMKEQHQCANLYRCSQESVGLSLLVLPVQYVQYPRNSENQVADQEQCGIELISD